jgi:hypothetical protein
MKALVVCFVFACAMVTVAGCSFFRPAPADIPTVAFDYHKPDRDDIDFLSHFDIVVTGKLLDADAVKRLKSRKAKLFYYDWLPATYYCKNHDDWEEMIYQKRFSWTLDPGDSDPNPLGERYGCMDLFYDMADEDFADVRADHIAYTVRSHNYDGVFFDWGSGWNAFKEHQYDFLMKEFSKRHPGINYNDKINEFIRRLKKKGLLVVLNGGFRSDGSKLDTYADYDIVESMFTAVNCDNSYYKIFLASGVIEKACDTWFNNTQRAVDLATRLTAEARKANPAIKFLFLNYAFPYFKPTGKSATEGGMEHQIYERTTDRQAIFYALACSYMGNASGFTAGSDVSLAHVKDDVYLHSPGTPVGGVHRTNDSVYVRYFSQGIVVVSDRDATVKISLPQGKSRVFDLYGKKYLESRDNELALSLTSEVYPSGLKHSIGRIYLYDGH